MSDNANKNKPPKSGVWVEAIDDALAAELAENDSNNTSGIPEFVDDEPLRDGAIERAYVQPFSIETLHQAPNGGFFLLREPWRGESETCELTETEVFAWLRLHGRDVPQCLQPKTVREPKRPRLSKKEVEQRAHAAIAFKMRNDGWNEGRCAKEAGLSQSTLNCNALWQEWLPKIEAAYAHGGVEKVSREFDRRIGESVAVDPDSE